jgi:hypothetical protein
VFFRTCYIPCGARFAKMLIKCHCCGQMGEQVISLCWYGAEYCRDCAVICACCHQVKLRVHSYFCVFCNCRFCFDCICFLCKQSRKQLRDFHILCDFCKTLNCGVGIVKCERCSAPMCAKCAKSVTEGTGCIKCIELAIKGIKIIGTSDHK